MVSEHACDQHLVFNACDSRLSMFQFLKIFTPPHQKDTHSRERRKLHEHRKARFISVLPHFYHAIFCHIFFPFFFTTFCHILQVFITFLPYFATCFAEFPSFVKPHQGFIPLLRFFFFGAREDGEITGQGRQELNGWSYVGGFLRGFGG